MRFAKAFFSALVVFLFAQSAFAGSSVDRTKALIAAFKKVKTPPENGALSAADKSANDAAFKELDQFFDYATLTSEPLSTHKAKFAGDQYQKTLTMFEELIKRVAYPNAGDFLRQAQYTLKDGKDPNTTEMHATLAKEDFETNVVFQYKDVGGQLKLIDVSFDGASLIKDYRAQFGKIIDKEGADGLVKKLSTRLDKERKKQGA
jgi:phospholipid transport system substrate-binding protein